MYISLLDCPYYLFQPFFFFFTPVIFDIVFPDFYSKGVSLMEVILAWLTSVFGGSFMPICGFFFLLPPRSSNSIFVLVFSVFQFLKGFIRMSISHYFLFPQLVCSFLTSALSSSICWRKGLLMVSVYEFL